MGLLDAVIGRDVILRPEIVTVIQNNIMFEVGKWYLSIEIPSDVQANTQKILISVQMRSNGFQQIFLTHLMIKRQKF